MDDYLRGLIGTVAQLRTQVEVMDRFLSWFCPDYARLKTLIEYQHQQPLTSLMHNPTVTVPTPLQNLTNSTIPHGPLKYPVPPYVVGGCAEENSGYGATYGGASATNLQNKQVITHNVGVNGLPLKRRGRKRKYPQPVTNDSGNKGETFKITQTNVYCMDSGIPIPHNTSIDARNPKRTLQQHMSANNLTSKHLELTSLNLLATVSSVLKTHLSNEEASIVKAGSKVVGAHSENSIDQDQMYNDNDAVPVSKSTEAQKLMQQLHSMSSTSEDHKVVKKQYPITNEELAAAPETETTGTQYIYSCVAADQEVFI